MSNYQLITAPFSVPIKAWVNGVQLEDAARQQLADMAKMPFIHSHIAVMPDVHMGMGATVGSVIPSLRAIIPAAVGVDIGCGMAAVRTSLTASQLPDSLAFLRSCIEENVPHGRSHDGGPNDKGAHKELPRFAEMGWKLALQQGYEEICAKFPKLGKGNAANHLGTLGTGNHFIEVCLDEEQRVWVVLHSGSRGVGNRFGSFFIEMAKEDCRVHGYSLPNKDLAYFHEGTEPFRDYVKAVTWAQEYAAVNRKVMLRATLKALESVLPAFEIDSKAVNCHHNYVSEEVHFGERVWLTRKGAVSAKAGELGIIPGSMGAKSYIVCGKGHAAAFCSCSHGAGRRMSRTEAKKTFTLADHAAATAGVECRKDEGVIDETPMAYKDIDSVMAAQTDMVDIKHTLKQVLCVKG